MKASGIKGLQGVVRKTVKDDLQVVIILSLNYMPVGEIVTQNCLLLLRKIPSVLLYSPLWGNLALPLGKSQMFHHFDIALIMEVILLPYLFYLYFITTLFTNLLLSSSQCFIENLAFLLLKVNIWDDVHMGKIIPSLLYNIDVQAGR